MKIHRFLKAAILAAPLCFAPLSAANADQKTAKLTAEYAYSGDLEKGIAELKKLHTQDPKNGEAVFGLGTLQFLNALAGLQQDLYRYGAGNNQGGGFRRSFLPVLRVPVAPNPNAETASYEITRGIFEKFVARMNEANITLAQTNELPFKMPLDLAKIRYDINGDGNASEEERFLPLLLVTTGMRGRGITGTQALPITFDTADAYWLQGYSNALMSIGNFFLSFDFEGSYEASFHTVFGPEATKFGKQFDRAKGDPEEIAEIHTQIAEIDKQREKRFSSEQSNRLNELYKMQRKIRKDKSLSKTEKKIKQGEYTEEIASLRKIKNKNNKLDREKRTLNRHLALLDSTVQDNRGLSMPFDTIGFLHSISWDVVEPDRLKTVRQNLLTVMQLNKVTWRLVQAETDNDHEWLPNSKQGGPFPSLNVTQETIDSWLKVTSAAEDVLEGRLLVPHMRYGRGTNMKRFFEEAKHFDLVLFLTGPNSIQYVEKGPVWDQTLMSALRGPMGRNFGAYALWFN